MFDRISASFALARSSWDVLYKDKQLLLFPVLSGIGCTLVLASFLIPLGVIAWMGGFQDLFNQINQNGAANVPVGYQIAFWVGLFLFYFCNYFVVVFCNAALISCAIMHFNGETPTLGDGFRAAGARLPQILAWALVSATVGILLKGIENSNRRVGEFISAILGTVWTVMTYFVVPVLVVEKVGPFKAIGRSIQILKATWGEALVGNLGLGFVKFLAVLPFFLLLAAGVAVLAASNGAGPLLVVGILVLVLAVLYFLVYLAVASAMDTIFLSALYQYAAFNTIPEGFEADTMEQAFRTRRQ
jgi:Family of unknown function (DUF6159)